MTEEKTVGMTKGGSGHNKEKGAKRRYKKRGAETPLLVKCDTLSIMYRQSFVRHQLFG